MGFETTSDQNNVKVPAITLPFPNAWWGRLLYALFITILPAFSFWATQLLKPEWQTGELKDYIILLLFPEASLLFFPLLAYSIISYLFLLLAPDRYSQLFFIRSGIYTGVLLALHYSIVVLVYSIDSFVYLIIMIWIIPFVFSMIYRWSVAKWTAPKVNNTLFILIPGVLLIGTLITRGGMPFFILVAVTMAAPFWSFLLALRAAIWLFKNNEAKLTFQRGLGLTAWIGAYVIAWRFNILAMYELYAALPPTPPPDCYIATAAARGHPKLVRSWTVQRADGKSAQVNAQLQRLKCAELALMAVNPQLHKILREVYDALGKPRARRIQNPFMADLAYLLLKPWEWMAGIVLKIIIPGIDSYSSKLYKQ